MSARLLYSLGLLTALALLGGCVSAPHRDRRCIGGELHERTGVGLGPAVGPCERFLPPGVVVEDGVGEDEAVALALWNNAAFQETLVDLGLAQADVVTAGLLPNPELWALYPVGPKQLEFALEFPLEALWLRPQRLAAARREAERAAAAQVQNGLNLVRDVRGAFADCLLARDRLSVAREAQRIRGRVSELAEARLAAGDASPVEADTARIDRLRTDAEAVRLERDVELADERLRNLIGLSLSDAPLAVNAEPPLPRVEAEPAALLDEALVCRPDARAARLAIAAAAERARLARCEWWRAAFIVDANSQGEAGFEIGPGTRFLVPLFNRNQGNIARTAAELERAERQLATLRDRIALEVRQAHAQFAQARAELDRWHGAIRPAVETAIGRAERAYRGGETSLLLALEATRQLLDAHLREAQLRSDLRRAAAELDRSVGRRVAERGPTP